MTHDNRELITRIDLEEDGINLESMRELIDHRMRELQESIDEYEEEIRNGINPGLAEKNAREIENLKEKKMALKDLRTDISYLGSQ